jgi:hypothetical protein
LHGDGSPAFASDFAHHPFRAFMIARIVHNHRRAFRAEAFAMPAPIPFEAPVTIATLSSSRFMASPRSLSAMPNYQFDQKSIRRSVRIASIPLGNRSVVRFGEQLSQKVNKHGDFAGLTAGRGSHGADRNSGRLTIAQDSPHGSGAYVGRKKPVWRLGDTEAGKDRGACSSPSLLRNDAAA